MPKKEQSICERNETCPICPHEHDCNSLYTPQQITTHCEELERCVKIKGAIAETSFWPISLQIIRQLLGECPKYAGYHDVDELYD